MEEAQEGSRENLTCIEGGGHTLNPPAHRGRMISMSLGLACSTQGVLEQPGIHRKNLS